MQNDISIVNGGISECEFSSFLDQSDGYGCSSLYSIFPPNPPLFSLSPSGYSTDENTQPIELPPYSEFLREHKDLIERRDWCLSHLRKTAKEAEALRQENINLQMANIELNKRFSLLMKASRQSMPVSASRYTRSSSLIDDFRRMSIGERAARDRRAWNEIPDESPASVSENEPVERTDVNRVSLPKSISVRSKGYLKAVQTVGSSGNRVRAPFRTVNEMQRVYINGGKRQEEPLEVKVYKQGVTKTELCNKWQQTGTCPYGEQCQFAHGIEELRPVLRHPRYKTEVCRMVLNGDPCPYAHRCHFRHSLTDQEKRLSAAANR